jgi:energy-coupling factor transporter ATP-binding protein EcfA2
MLTFESVRFSYGRSDRPAIDDLRLNVAAGEVLGIVGANGSGKTTLAKLANGLLRPDLGRITVDGLDAAGTPVRTLAAHAGLAFQNPNHQLFASTVAEELAFGPRNLGVPGSDVDDRVRTAAGQLGLEQVLHLHPYRLGVAMRKLVAIGSVLTMRTPLLILDEPTAGQDHRTVRTLAGLVGDLRAEGRSVVIVGHDTAFLAPLVDRLMIMAAGRLVAEGPPRLVLAGEATLAAAALGSPQVSSLSGRLRLAARPPDWRALSVDELAAAITGSERP